MWLVDVLKYKKNAFHDKIVEVPMTSLSARHVRAKVTFGKTRQITIIIRNDLLIISKFEALNIVWETGGQTEVC